MNVSMLYAAQQLSTVCGMAASTHILMEYANLIEASLRKMVQANVVFAEACAKSCAHNKPACFVLLPASKNRVC
eukprot:20636-Heterococcus_DN1.PRE.4